MTADAPLSPRERWAALHHAALLGLDRAPAGAASPEDLLREAAVLDARAAAGTAAAAEGPEPPAEDPPAEDPPRPAAAADALREALDADDADLLALACLGLARAGVPAAPELLPRLLDRAADPAAPDTLRRAAADALGHRGRWLAAMHPAWARLLPPGDPAREAADRRDSDATKPSVRGAALRRRVLDDPADARRLVREVLPEENAAGRVAAVAALDATPAEARTPGLEADDLDLLRGLLTDTAASVRVAAARSLAARPGTEEAARVAALARGCVRAETTGRLRRSTALVVEVPDEAVEAAAALAPGLAAGQPGVKARALQELIALAPLDAWAGLAPEVWVASALACDWKTPLLGGWLLAVAAQPAAPAAPAWAAALLHPPGGAEPFPQAVLQTATPLLPALLARLPAADRPALLKPPKDAPFSAAEALAAGLGADEDPPDAAWPPALSEAALRWLGSRPVRENPHEPAIPWHLRTAAARRLGLNLDLATADRLLAGDAAPDLPALLGPAADPLAALLRVRRLLARALPA